MRQNHLSFIRLDFVVFDVAMTTPAKAAGTFNKNKLRNVERPTRRAAGVVSIRHFLFGALIHASRYKLKVMSDLSIVDICPFFLYYATEDNVTSVASCTD